MVTGQDQQRVTTADNNALLTPFTLEEFYKAVFSMHPHKAPSPDGLNPAFFQKFCYLIENDIVAASTEWLVSDHSPIHLKILLLY